MHKKSEEIFVETSLDIIKDEIAKEGIIIKKISHLKDAVIKIGKLYYSIKKKEEM